MGVDELWLAAPLFFHRHPLGTSFLSTVENTTPDRTDAPGPALEAYPSPPASAVGSLRTQRSRWGKGISIPASLRAS